MVCPAAAFGGGRDEGGDAFAAEFGEGIAEEFFGGGVGAQDFTGFLDDEDGVAGVLHDFGGAGDDDSGGVPGGGVATASDQKDHGGGEERDAEAGENDVERGDAGGIDRCGDRCGGGDGESDREICQAGAKVFEQHSKVFD